MLSDRLYQMISIICRLGCKLGSFGIRFDQNRLLVFRTKVIKSVYIIQLLYLFWFIYVFVLTIKEYTKHGYVTNIVIKVMFTIFWLIMGLLYSVIHIFLDDMIIFFNGTLIFYRYVQGKSEIYTCLNIY